MQKLPIFVAAACLAAMFVVGANQEARAQAPAPDPAGQATYGGAASGQGGGQGGAATAGVFAPVLDSEKRPITAGGFVKSGRILFVDIVAKAGLGGWKHTMGTPAKHYIIETT